jgi:hypothetical protein
MGEKAVAQRTVKCAQKKENNVFVAQRMRFDKIKKAFQLEESSIKKIKKVVKKNKNLKKWFEDAMKASKYVNDVNYGEEDFESVKDNGIEKILGGPDAHYPGKEDDELKDEMKIITILHELMHTFVRNGSYDRGNFQGILKDIEWENDIQKKHFSSISNVNVHNCPVNVSSVGDFYAQSHNASLNINNLFRCLFDDQKKEKIEGKIYELIFSRIHHMTNLSEYDAVLGDLIYYMMRKMLTETRTYKYANILLKDANKRRHNKKMKLNALDEEGNALTA